MFCGRVREGWKSSIVKSLEGLVRLGGGKVCVCKVGRIWIWGVS